VYTKGYNVFINWTEVENSPLKGILQYCRYDVIWRPKNERHNHDFYKYLKGKVNFYSFITVKEDYIRVQCFSANESVVYSNFFSFIHDDVIPNNNSNDDTFNKHQKTVDETLSVSLVYPRSSMAFMSCNNTDRVRFILRIIFNRETESIPIIRTLRVSSTVFWCLLNVSSLLLLLGITSSCMKEKKFE
jgi:hypothetical protein